MDQESVRTHKLLSVLERLRVDIAEGRIKAFACVGIDEFSSPRYWSAHHYDTKPATLIGAVGAMHVKIASKGGTDGVVGREIQL